MVTPEDNIVYYENESFMNRTSHILDRYCCYNINPFYLICILLESILQ